MYREKKKSTTKKEESDSNQVSNSMLDDIELINKFHRKLFLMQNFISKEISIKCKSQLKSSQIQSNLKSLHLTSIFRGSSLRIYSKKMSMKLRKKNMWGN